MQSSSRIFWIWNASRNVKPVFIHRAAKYKPTKTTFSAPILTSQEIFCFVFFCWTCRNHSVKWQKWKMSSQRKFQWLKKTSMFWILTVRRFLIINCFLIHRWNIMIGRQSASDMILTLCTAPCKTRLSESKEWAGGWQQAFSSSPAEIIRKRKYWQYFLNLSFCCF